MLGEALELAFGCDLTIGPNVEEGFYYDCFLGDRTLAEEDCAVVEKAMEKAVKARKGGRRRARRVGSLCSLSLRRICRSGRRSSAWR